MMRPVLFAALVTLLAACTAGDDTLDRDVTRLVNETEDAYDPMWSPDGTRLAFVRELEGRAAVFVADSAGNGATRLTRGVWDTDPLWSPDGQWLAYYSDEDANVMVVSSMGGTPRQLTSGPMFDNPAGWLRDGSGVIFYRTSGGVVRTLVAPLDGGAPRPLLASNAEGNLFVALSPDGSKYVYDLHRGGRGTIWVQDVAGGAPRQLTAEGFENQTTQRAWSPDSRSILFESRRNGTSDLWIADVATGTLRQLTDDIRNDVSGRWSPDSRHVAFISTRGGQTDVWLVPASGGAAVRVTSDRAVEADLTWSADGQRLLYRSQDVSNEVHVTTADGANPRSLFAWDNYTVENLQVSPDGAQTMFESNRSGNQDLWTVPLAGGEPAPLVVSPLYDGQGMWSPDGSTVAFISNRGSTNDLWVMPAAGGEARRLTDWPSVEISPRWSPDGRTIAFLSNREANSNDVWTVPAAGGPAIRVTRGNTDAADLAWTRDGRELLYSGATANDSRQLFRVPAIGGAPRPVTSATIPNLCCPRVSHDGAHLGYTVLDRGWAFIEVVPLAGGPARRLTRGTESVYEIDSKWSPDGSRLLIEDWNFQTNRNQTSVLNVATGDKQVVVGNDDRHANTARWTPDGNQLVLIRARTNRRIFTVRVTELLAAPAVAAN